ncbi:hypothetical protein IMSAGC003_02506 [Lachnospiraceae bacterium]|nr:hypothetical protein IMSAGC003_02506 [Lachnospiraceae bacterium]
MLGFLLVMSLSMLAALWTRGSAYVAGLTALLFLGPGAGLVLAEKMLVMFGSSFYRSEMLEQLKGYLSPVSLLKNVTGIEEYADGAGWVMEVHLPYLLYLAAAVVFLFLLNLFFFRIRPAEPKRGGIYFSCCGVGCALWLCGSWRSMVYRSSAGFFLWRFFMGADDCWCRDQCSAYTWTCQYSYCP